MRSNKTTSGISYRKLGQGPALMLIHGFPENGVLWQQVWDSLAEKFTILVIDLPGSGESIAVDESLSMDDMAKAVKDVLDAEHIEEVVLAGHSMGGYVALAFAAIYGKQVNGLSMVHSSAYADDEEKKKTRNKAIELIRKGGKEPFVRQMITGLFAANTKEEQPEMVEKQVQSGLELDAISLIAYYKAMINRPDRTEMLKTAAFPVQWIIGKEDTVIPFTIGLQQSNLSNVNFVSLYERTGHMSMLEQPAKLKADLLKFLSYCYRDQ